MNGRVKRKRYVTVSGLAAYAVNPERYILQKGGPDNEKAAAYGNLYHKNFTKQSRRKMGVVWLTAIGLSLLALLFLL